MVIPAIPPLTLIPLPLLDGFGCTKKCGINVSPGRAVISPRVKMHRLGGLKNDFAYAFRMMARAPGFTVVAAVTLVLGIGATTAIFSVVNAVLLRTLPYKDPGELVHLLANDPGDPRSGVSYEAYQLWRSQNRSFSELAVYYRNSGWSRVTMGGSVEPQSGQAGFTSASFFSAMGVSPVLGRVFTEVEERERTPIAVLSNSLWEHSFAKDTGVLGRTLEVDGQAFTIVGVMPRSFQLPAPETLLWLPITTNRYWLERRDPTAFTPAATICAGTSPGGFVRV